MSGHQDFLISDIGRQEPLGDESQLEVVDDFGHHGKVDEEGDDTHLAPAVRANESVNFIDFA